MTKPLVIGCIFIGFLSAILRWSYFVTITVALLWASLYWWMKQCRVAKRRAGR